MAIKLSDFEKASYKAAGKTIEVPNLYQSIREDKQKGKKFLARFTYEKKIYKKILGYSKKDNLTPKSANKLLEAYIQDIETGYTSSDKINLNHLFDIYTTDLDVSKRWTADVIGIYDRYIKHKVIQKGLPHDTKRHLSLIGEKELLKIREMDIKSILSDMKKKGYSPRTQKSVLEVLKPLFKFALKNRYLKENPIIDITIKIPSQKKVVINATELFNNVYKGIVTYYKDEPFYQALFLFGLTGRRKGEILHLKWENIDFQNDYYWIEDTKTGDKQKYPLPPYIKKQLLLIPDNHKGLVFKSPITSKALVYTERQINQLKKHTGIENLSFHYMRNILVSMLAEQQVEAVVLSGILGHKDVNTINKYLSINHYKSGQTGLNKIDTILMITGNE